MMPKLTTLTTALALLSASQVAANNDNAVIWALNEAPPFHMAAGPERGQGFCEKLVAAAIRVTPEFVHDVQYVPNLRGEMLWQNKQNLCFPCMIHRHPPQSSVIYSAITHHYSPHGLITRPELADRLIQQFGNPIDLAALSQTDQYRFVQHAGRGYGSLQATVVKFILSSLKTSVLTGDHGAASIFAMIASGRVDYTIDYPFVMDYFAAQSDQSYRFIPILQNYQEVVAGAMACTDNAWGRNVIERLDARMSSMRDDQDFVEALERWLPNRPRSEQE
jgi:uncharacterized protein (TIGR02285 family)